MSHNQISIIKQYLEIETNYAVILNGKYGVGKTHFFKNVLSPEIEKVALAKDARKKFIPIHISLFGLKSVEEIQSEIFLALYPILNSKKLKLAVGIGKTLARGIAQVYRAGDIDKYIGDISKAATNWLSYEELVICFDDLDRKSESLKLQDVFGFINSLVENQGAKILIIAHEEQLQKDSTYSSALREKVIGVTIQYIPEPNTVYDMIITEKYAAPHKTYFDFLLSRKEVIVQAIRMNESNFRNLIFFLEHFRTIYYPLVDQFEQDKDFAHMQEEKLCAVLHFTLAVSIDYKLGLLNSANINELVGLNDFQLGSLEDLLSSPTAHSDEEGKSTPSYAQSFREKYFPEPTYYFFKSIIDYITGQGGV